eukprot:365651-Chlamydomonas_euryale.AAC.4
MSCSKQHDVMPNAPPSCFVAERDKPPPNVQQTAWHGAGYRPPAMAEPGPARPAGLRAESKTMIHSVLRVWGHGPAVICRA